MNRKCRVCIAFNIAKCLLLFINNLLSTCFQRLVRICGFEFCLCEFLNEIFLFYPWCSLIDVSPNAEIACCLPVEECLLPLSNNDAGFYN